MDVGDVVGDLVGVAAVADADLVLERGFEGGRERKRTFSNIKANTKTSDKCLSKEWEGGRGNEERERDRDGLRP